MHNGEVRGGKVYFVGAGPGDPELITLRGRRILDQADLIIYTGSLTGPALFEGCKPAVTLQDSAKMHLEEIVAAMMTAARARQVVVRLHDGDPSIFGALLEQAALLAEAGIPYETVPGVSSVFAAAAALDAELTIPDLTQTVILTRMTGRTPVPEKERLRDLAAHEATLVLFLSAGLIEKAVAELKAGYPAETPVAVVYKASCSDQKIVRGTLKDIARKVREAKIHMHALIMVGKVFDSELRKEAHRYRSRLYDKTFTHRYRKAVAAK